MRDSERAVAAARLTTQQAEQEAAVSGDGRWRSVAQEARRRSGGDAACCICCEPLQLRPVVLLSCAHRLHHACLAALESFTQGRQLSSPWPSQRGEARGEQAREREAEQPHAPRLLFVPPGSLCPLCRSPYAKIAEPPSQSADTDGI